MNSRQTMLLCALVVIPLLGACHRTQAVQRGYRGQDSIEIYSESTLRKLDEINIKGTNVDEVIEEMELAARRILAGLDSALERYASTAKVPVPGSPQAFAHQLAREYNLKREVLDAILAIINQIPEDLITVYDVIQAFTQVTHDLPYADRAKLQTLGGTLALDTERMIARCTSCEQLLH